MLHVACAGEIAPAKKMVGRVFNQPSFLAWSYFFQDTSHLTIFRGDHLRQDYSQSGDSLVDPISEGRSCQTPRQHAELQILGANSAVSFWWSSP